MTTCKDCLHCDVCHAVHIGGFIQECAEACKNFKDGSRYIELPCKVGDVVWDRAGEPHKVISIEWYSKKVTHLHCEKHTFSIGKRSLGKTIFLSREDAEKALKGCE